jgi:hypothetical protein
MGTSYATNGWMKEYNFWNITRILSIPQNRLIFLQCKPVVLYGCETWSITLREEHRLRAFENGVLTKIFGLRGGQGNQEWRRVHNEEVYGLYSSLNINRLIKSRRMGWAGHVTRVGDRKGAYRVLVGKPVGRRPLARPRPRGQDNIKVNR